MTVVTFPDLLGWEREAIEPFQKLLNQICQPNTINLTRQNFSKAIQDLPPTPLWVLAEGVESIERLFSSCVEREVFFSVLGWRHKSDYLSYLFLKSLFRAKPKQFQWISHCPMSHRFLVEMQKQTDVSYLPLPVSGELDRRFRGSNGKYRVGTVARFTSENNLNFFLAVAHYVTQKNSSVEFLITGEGPLENHLERTIADMGLGKHVQLAHDGAHFLSDVDCLLYLPLQNHHFLPLHLAACYGLAVIACDTPGLEEYVQDGHTGFVVAMYDTKAMGELVLRLACDALLSESLSKSFRSEILSRFEIERLKPLYRQFFSERLYTSDHTEVTANQAA